VSRKIWVICLAIWFGLYAIFALTDIGVKLRDVIMGLLAAAVCILALLDR
jgi:hypothetical protein